MTAQARQVFADISGRALAVDQQPGLDRFAHPRHTELVD